MRALCIENNDQRKLISQLTTPLDTMTGQDAAMPSRSTDIDPTCIRVRRDLHDPFFLKGYQLAFEGTVYYVENNEGGVSPTKNQDEEYAEHTNRFPCGVCSLSFPSLIACEAHYEESHVFQCNECYAILPSDRLLDLHLQEAHDSYFAAGVERGVQKFSCLVCENEFGSCQDRLVHLMEIHGYPKWFRFIAKARLENDTKKKLKWMDQRSKRNSEDDNLMVEETNTRKQERRARQKEKRATIPCKFHLSKGGCWRGDKCMFLHSDHMDDLSMQLSTKARVSVPENFSFGRRRR